MTTSRGAIHYRRLRAPREHGVTIVDPPLEAAPCLAAENISLARAHLYDFQGRCLDALAQQAHEELLVAAAKYTRSYRNVNLPEASGPILLTGHQPELYHPGVWFKNFAASAAARRMNAFAVNLLIDNDTIRSAAIRVPQGTLTEPKAGRVAFDRPSEEIPFEERTVQDAELFESFAERVRSSLAPFVKHPLVDGLWPLAVEAMRRDNNLGRCLSRARHRLEAKWGLGTLELPLSAVCQGEPFRWFVAHLLAHLPQFQEVYNACLAEYCRVHRIRSRTHPVPPLGRRDEWREAPFWVWSAAEPRRQRLFVRQRGRDLELSDLRRWRSVLSLHRDGNGARAVDQLGGIAAAGVRLRPRALLTTMFARLLLGDLFFHGIGGAKYDQLTDLIIQRFFRLTPPSFVVLTATAKLPVRRPQGIEEELRRLNWLMRELRFNPQRHVSRTEETEPWLAEKQRWIEHEVSCQDRGARHRAISRINEALRPFVDLQRSRLVEERARCLMLLQQDKLFDSREYSFCLFPEETLRFLLLDF